MHVNIYLLDSCLNYLSRCPSSFVLPIVSKSKFCTYASKYKYMSTNETVTELDKQVKDALCSVLAFYPSALRLSSWLCDCLTQQ
jgi:hypothetical protein